MWKFDPTTVELVWVVVPSELIFDGLTEFGDSQDSDLEISFGERENDSSVVDNGNRIIEV